MTAGRIEPTGAAAPVFLAGGAALRVVFDTNVLLSLFVFADSRFAPLRAEVEAGRWQALTDERCLAEFRRVLGYPLFALDERRQAQALAAWQALARIPPPPVGERAPLPACKDRDDQKFLELARDGGADWLVTADKALLKLARRQKLAHLFCIVTPEAALDLTFMVRTPPADDESAKAFMAPHPLPPRRGGGLCLLATLGNGGSPVDKRISR